jgi:glycerophosphoryl diester phosphodiesterase
VTGDVSGYAGDGGPYAVAHRGGAGLAPENTIAAFERSYALGVRYLETDVRLTADGVCVAFHDARLRRTTGVRGRLADLTWDDVRDLRVGGEPVPRLADLLDAFPDARFTIDVKEARALAPLAADVHGCRAADRVCLAGAADRVLAEARESFGLATALGWESLTRLALCARTGNRPRWVTRAQFAHVPLRLGRIPVFAERLVALAADLGVRVLVWTVDDPALMHRLLDEGVDGVITDRPDLLREVLVARDAWTAPQPAGGAGGAAGGRAAGGRTGASSSADAPSMPATP